MSSKREQERAELHRTIWGIANNLRGTVVGWDFKQYVLGMIFYRYISENLAIHINKIECESGHSDFDYTNLTDDLAEPERKNLVQEKGFFILSSELFTTIQKNASKNENLNETYLCNKFFNSYCAILL